MSVGRPRIGRRRRRAESSGDPPIGPPSEPVLDLNTTAGRLLLPQADEIITPILRETGVWEAVETAWLRSVLAPDQTFVDVGAHVGYFSVLAWPLVQPGGRVIALEPERRNHDLLARNLARNGCLGAEARRCAAGKHRGWMSLALDELNRGNHRLVPLGAGADRIEVVRLDDVLPERVDVVKIDAQGYDHEIVEGLERTLGGNPQLQLLVELSVNELPNRGVDATGVLERYEELGLRIAMFDAHGRLFPASADDVVQRVACATNDFSLVLTRGGRPGAARSGYPAQVSGIELSADGLTVTQVFRRRGHELNETAALILELCSGDHSVAEIVALVQEAYALADPPADEVHRCLRELAEAGLLRPGSL